MTLSGRLIEFAHFLRQNRIPADTRSTLLAHQIAETGLLTTRAELQAGLRSCFCKSADHWQRFDALFYLFWLAGEVDDLDPVAFEPGQIADGSLSGVQSLLGFGGTSSEKLATDLTGAGDYKALSLADFRFVFDPYEMQLVAQLVEQMASKARKTLLRKEQCADKGQRIDIARSMHSSMRTAATIMRFRYRQRERRLPRFVLLLDVSQSMDVYAKLFLRFIRQILSVFEYSYAYAFNIELMYLGQGSRELTEMDIESKFNQLSQSWLGGTKIASSLETFNQRHLRRVVNHKTTVVIFSDGYDTDPVERLIPQVATLQRCARRLIWVNPLLGRFDSGEKDPKMDPLQDYISSYHSAHNVHTLFELQSALLK